MTTFFLIGINDITNKSLVICGRHYNHIQREKCTLHERTFTYSHRYSTGLVKNNWRTIFSQKHLRHPIYQEKQIQTSTSTISEWFWNKIHRYHQINRPYFRRKIVLGAICKILKRVLHKKNIIKILFNNNWGVDKDTLLETYRALIRSKLHYGSNVYNSAKNYTKKIIEPVPHTVLRLATDAYRTCPINSLLKYTVKMSSTTNNPSYSNIFFNRYKTLYSNKPKFPSRFYVRLTKIL